MSAFGIPEKPIDYESSGDILFVDRNENLADPRGTRKFHDIENAIACARLGPLKDRIRIVDWSEYSVLEQLELTYNAAAIISIHGAGLSNTLWMRPGSQIIELIPYKVLSPNPEMGGLYPSILVQLLPYNTVWIRMAVDSVSCPVVLCCCSFAGAAISREQYSTAWR